MTFILTCHNAEVYLNALDCCCKYWSGNDEFSCYSLFGEGKNGLKAAPGKTGAYKCLFLLLFF